MSIFEKYVKIIVFIPALNYYSYTTILKGGQHMLNEQLLEILENIEVIKLGDKIIYKKELKKELKNKLLKDKKLCEVQ